MTTQQIIKKNNLAIVRRIVNKIRIMELHEINPKTNPNNPIYNEPLK